ncbi:basic proline-rich protein-like [Vidua macroura]|uniref:basic proline-rich protein-like n=1 Tax=Vidua macroura TaxID=187451 RepID=UPI0023A8AEC6|nr:basic proline-rich protein-like [Vidua macroura]
MAPAPCPARALFPCGPLDPIPSLVTPPRSVPPSSPRSHQGHPPPASPHLRGALRRPEPTLCPTPPPIPARPTGVTPSPGSLLCPVTPAVPSPPPSPRSLCAPNAAVPPRAPDLSRPTMATVPRDSRPGRCPPVPHPLPPSPARSPPPGTASVRSARPAGRPGRGGGGSGAGSSRGSGGQRPRLRRAWEAPGADPAAAAPAERGGGGQRRGRQHRPPFFPPPHRHRSSGRGAGAAPRTAASGVPQPRQGPGRTRVARGVRGRGRSPLWGHGARCWRGHPESRRARARSIPGLGDNPTGRGDAPGTGSAVPAVPPSVPEPSRRAGTRCHRHAHAATDGLRGEHAGGAPEQRERERTEVSRVGWGDAEAPRRQHRGPSRRSGGEGGVSRPAPRSGPAWLGAIYTAAGAWRGARAAPARSWPGGGRAGGRGTSPELPGGSRTGSVPMAGVLPRPSRFTLSPPPPL